MLLIQNAITSEVRSLAARPRQLRDGTMEKSKVISGITVPDLLFYILVPAATIHLIQEDKERIHGHQVTFDEAFNILVDSSALGDLLHPDPETLPVREPSVDELARLIVQGQGKAKEVED